MLRENPSLPRKPSTSKACQWGSYSEAIKTTGGDSGVCGKVYQAIAGVKMKVIAADG
jgi:hypothetical protein